MRITGRAIVRRLSGLSAAAIMFVAGYFVFSEDIPTEVAARTFQRPGEVISTTLGVEARQGPSQTRSSPNPPGALNPPASNNPHASTTSPPVVESTSSTSTTAAVDETTTTSRVRSSTTTTAAAPVVQGEKFSIELKNLDTGVDWWRAPYLRALAYTPNTGWTDGDRIGYGCAYMFLERDGRIVGRVSFVQVPGTTYVKVNDRYMEEGVRFFDGSLTNAGTTQAYHVSFCDTIVDQDYVEFTGPDQRPTIRYLGSDGALLEVRDYKPTAAGPGIKFRQVAATANRVTVVAYENNLPVIVVYYDSLDPSVRLTSDLP